MKQSSRETIPVKQKRRSTQASVAASKKGARTRAKMLAAQKNLADPASVKVVDQAVKRFSGALGRLGDR